MTDKLIRLMNQFDDEALSEQRPDYREQSIENYLSGLPSSDSLEIARRLCGGGAYRGAMVLGREGDRVADLDCEGLNGFGRHVKETFVEIGREFPGLKKKFPQLFN